MHSKGKGISNSCLPYRRTAPSWLKTSSREVVDQICKLAKKGVPPAQIGIQLRDSHGIGSVKSITGVSSFIFKISLSHRPSHKGGKFFEFWSTMAWPPKFLKICITWSRRLSMCGNIWKSPGRTRMQSSVWFWLNPEFTDWPATTSRRSNCLQLGSSMCQPHFVVEIYFAIPFSESSTASALVA